MQYIHFDDKLDRLTGLTILYILLREIDFSHFMQIRIRLIFVTTNLFV